MSIADQKTPGRPTEITYAALTGIPSANQELMLIGHRGAGAASGTAIVYEVTTMNNVADLAAAKTESEAKFGVASELSKMVLAAVKANAGGGTFPAIKCVALASSDAAFGASDIALTNAAKVKAEIVASCYDLDDTTLRGKIKSLGELMSGATRVQNNQFGTITVAANQDITDPSTLPAPDSQFISGVYGRDSDPAYSVAELAAAYGAKLASNFVPFLSQDNVTIGSVPAPTLLSDNLSIGGGMESEIVLGKGITPLKVKPNGEVAIVRAVTSRITSDSVTPTSAYIDVEDFQILYLWRKTLVTRFNQPDFANAKASEANASRVLAEVIRLASAFEDLGMFQGVALLAKKFKVSRSLSDRSRFDIFTPTNVIPNLHVMATNIQATTEGDVLSI